MSWVRWTAGTAAAALAIAAVGIPVYVAPRAAVAAADAQAADVVYVIGPPTDARMEVAREQVAAGLADAVMISLNPEESAEWPEAAAACTGEWAGDPDERVAAATVLCDMPDPFTTRGEARWLESEMASRGWESVNVVTFTPHVSRAKMIIERCETGEVRMVDSGESLDPWYWVYQYAYQSAAFVKAGLLTGC
ncbi:hypothetical protein [Demequina sp.]|uniref:hypothetical protein n=1 Tax=Demequina sp. TaxID=2050685 RepID=UPI003A881F52